MAPQPTNRSTVGIAKEPTPGIATVPTDYLVCTLDPTPKITQLPDQGWRGSQVDRYGSQQGKRHHELDLKGDVFVDTFGFLGKGILGDETVTGSGPYTHAFASLNSSDGQPPKWSLTDFYVAASKVYSYTVFSQLKIALNPDGLLTWEAKALSYFGTTPSNPIASYSGLTPMQGWRATALINGTAAQLAKADVTISRSVKVIPGTNNSQNPYAIWGGELSVDIAATAILESDALLTDMAADNQGVFSLTLDRFASTLQEKVLVTCSKAAYGDVAIRRGDEYVTAEVPLMANANTTDAGASGGYSPVKLTVVNARSTAY